MKIAILIPARYASKRFEGKVIATVLNKPMIQWVYDGVKGSKLSTLVAVLTDDERIYKTVEAFGGRVFMVEGNFNSGTDRIAYFCLDKDFDYVVNVQADEPLIDSKVVDELINCAIDGKEEMATLVSLCTEEELENTNVVKVVVDRNGYALYFSRSRIPFNRNPFSRYLKHIGVYVYSLETLLKLNSLKPSSLEVAEDLEQLRALENGIKIKTCYTDKYLIGVDTREDLERISLYLERNSV